jgi:hypothetical protein
MLIEELVIGKVKRIKNIIKHKIQGKNSILACPFNCLRSKFNSPSFKERENVGMILQ